jgi:hypothetical protein
MTFTQATPHLAAISVRRVFDPLRSIRLIGLAALLVAGFSVAPEAFAGPRLRCEVTYAGRTQVVEAAPVSDPYSVASVDIAGRFRFKAVMMGNATQLAYINLYAYFVAEDEQPRLIHEGKYLPTNQWTVVPVALTGTQHLYAGPLERELIYSCTLVGDAP